MMAGIGQAYIGVFIGAPIVPYYYSPYAYPRAYYPPAVVSAPPGYIEQSTAALAPGSSASS